MKKLLAILLSLTLIVGFLPVCVSAEGGPTISLTTDASGDLKVGDTFTVTASLADNAEGFASLTLSLLWNSEIVRFDGFQTVFNEDDEVYELKDTILAQQVLFNDETGVVANSRTSNSTKNGTIFLADFTVIGEGECGIGLDQSSISAFTFRNIDNVDIDATIDVSTVSNLKVNSSGNQGNENAGYTASITVDPTEVEVTKTGTVKVNVTHGQDTAFAAGEVILTIPSNVTVAETGAVKNASGAAVDYKVTGTTLTIEDYGVDKGLGDGVYVITYTAGDTAGAASFALSDAAFSDKDTAKTDDLIDATVDMTAKVVNIINAPVTVTIDSSATGFFKYATSAPYGKDYTFTKEETTGDYYNYSAVQYKVGDGAWTSLTESNGSWTIPGSAVTGPITITGTRAGITPNVTWDGDGAADITNKPTAQYGVDFVVTLPNDKEPDTTPGYVYGINATMNGQSIGSFDSTNRKFTILGTAITGDFTVIVTKETKAADQFEVEISSTPNLSTDVTANPTVVDKNGSTTLTLNREPGYTYEITVDGVDRTAEFESDNAYTVTDVQATVTVNVTKTIDITNAKATYYLGINSTEGKAMWLITIAPDAAGNQLNQKHYTYNSKDMYWSSEYGAYCYLVIGSNTAPTLNAADFTITNGIALTVDYGKDVNDTDFVDANDAQLVYNMYNKVYSEFDSELTVENFLRADVNANALIKTGDTSDAINVDDAAAIITAILNGTANPNS